MFSRKKVKKTRFGGLQGAKTHCRQKKENQNEIGRKKAAEISSKSITLRQGNSRTKINPEVLTPFEKSTPV